MRDDHSLQPARACRVPPHARFFRRAVIRERLIDPGLSDASCARSPAQYPLPMPSHAGSPHGGGGASNAHFSSPSSTQYRLACSQMPSQWSCEGVKKSFEAATPSSSRRAATSAAATLEWGHDGFKSETPGTDYMGFAASGTASMNGEWMDRS